MAFDSMKTEQFPEGFDDPQKEMMHALRFDIALCNLTDDLKIQVLMALVRELKNGNQKIIS